MMALSVSSLAQALGEVPPDNIIFGRSEVMQAVRSRLGKVAAANVPVILDTARQTERKGEGKIVPSLEIPTEPVDFSDRD